MRFPKETASLKSQLIYDGLRFEFFFFPQIVVNKMIA